MKNKELQRVNITFSHFFMLHQEPKQHSCVSNMWLIPVMPGWVNVSDFALFSFLLNETEMVFVLHFFPAP